MDFDISFLGENGIDIKTGIEYTGNKEKYVSALRRFFSSYDDNRKKTEGSFAKGDMEEYLITVHALKSNSKMVGALSLADAFEGLENAARNGDISFVISNNEKVMADYKRFVELIRPIGEADIEPPADEINGKRAREISQELLAALDDFDDELSMELAKKLWGYPFRLRQREKMNQAIKHISDFRYDEAAQIIREITGEIE